jgi:hypothetical protein
MCWLQATPPATTKCLRQRTYKVGPVAESTHGPCVASGLALHLGAFAIMRKSNWYAYVYVKTCTRLHVCVALLYGVLWVPAYCISGSVSLAHCIPLWTRSIKWTVATCWNDAAMSALTCAHTRLQTHALVAQWGTKQARCHVRRPTRPHSARTLTHTRTHTHTHAYTHTLSLLAASSGSGSRA